ncbi:hypothetical protein [Thioalkalivibrio sp. XN279]|uniref:hypothetical protein n=1 Tax=Thioalkalivibrio sp. XN279 TaxID=2714953 RepID=UPI001408E001|nr:hypothetical protein [Thioalkalivibrio sp. XN279]NHA13983.1 hypothetical protein [Thioalkalivibrio sp. XN279]
MSLLLRALVLPAIFMLAACSYGPERTALALGNVVAKPQSHQLAVTLEYRRVREPTGALNTFPDGGIRKVIHREARVYLCDLDRGTAELVATIPDFAGIPHPKSVWIQGWQADALYFSLFGYGGDRHSGDDLSDERRLFFRITPDGRVLEIDELPEGLERGRNSGPAQSPPFLRWSAGHLDIEIAIDALFSETTRRARLTFDSETGEPRLSMP